ncbi:unnamed protein product, partial [Rotaria sordida]
LNEPESNQNIRLYHGTDVESIKKICQYGINLYASHRLGSDFGPVELLCFLDALYVANKKGLRNQTLGGVICFQLGESELSQFKIQELTEKLEQCNDPLEWSNFVKLCRRRFHEYPHMLRRDAFRGAICNNAERVRLFENERPVPRVIDYRKPIQIRIKSTNMACKLEDAIMGIHLSNGQLDNLSYDRRERVYSDSSTDNINFNRTNPLYLSRYRNSCWFRCRTSSSSSNEYNSSNLNDKISSLNSITLYARLKRFTERLLELERKVHQTVFENKCDQNISSKTDNSIEKNRSIVEKKRRSIIFKY